MAPLCLMLGLVLGGPTAQAEGRKNLSVDVSLGIRPDMAGLGSTIAKDGTVDTGDTTMANLLYSTDKVFMGDQSNQTLWHNSDQTKSTFKMMGEEPVLGGALLGGEVGLRLRYDVTGAKAFPVFFQGGVFRTQSISGGEQERVLGNAAQKNASVAALLALNGEDPKDYIGGKMSTRYEASWWEIPLSLGLRLDHPKRPYTAAYGSVGVSIFSGGFSVAFDADENYANVLATHIDADTQTVTNLSPGAVSDQIRFNITAVGLNYGLGVQAGTKSGLAFFAELNSSGASKTVYGTVLKDESKQLLTALSSQNLANEDAEWFDSLAYPVLTTGATFRLGTRYYFF